MLPKFKIVEWQGRFIVETGGILSTSGVSWGTRAKAEENIERCKRRLRA